jgi:hypothetical protein
MLLCSHLDRQNVYRGAAESYAYSTTWPSKMGEKDPRDGAHIPTHSPSRSGSSGRSPATFNAPGLKTPLTWRAPVAFSLTTHVDSHLRQPPHFRLRDSSQLCGPNPCSLCDRT